MSSIPTYQLTAPATLVEGQAYLLKVDERIDQRPEWVPVHFAELHRLPGHHRRFRLLRLPAALPA